MDNYAASQQFYLNIIFLSINYQLSIINYQNKKKDGARPLFLFYCDQEVVFLSFLY